MASEPGLDRHEWESEWQALEEPLADSPRDALPELDELVARMLEDRGFALSDPIDRSGDEPEIVAEFLAARETTRRLESDPADVSPGDVAAAVNGYRGCTTTCWRSAGRRRNLAHASVGRAKSSPTRHRRA